MRKTTLFLLLLLLIAVVVMGLLYLEKSNRPSPPVPNLSSADQLTRTELEEMIAECVTGEDWAELARVYMAQGYFPEAKATFGRAVELLPNYAEVVYDYGFCLGRVGDLEESNRQLERAIELKHPKEVEAMFFIGRNHLRSGDIDAAEQAFRKTGALPISKYELAKLLFRKGELDEAEALVKKLLAEEPDTVQSLTLLGNIRKKKGDDLAALGNSIESRLFWSRRIPTPFGDERANLMANYNKVGYGKKLNEMVAKTNQMANQEARKGLKKLLEMEWNLAAQESLIQCSNQSSRTHIAIGLIEDRLERFGPSSKWYAKLGETYLKRNETAKALEVWKTGANLNSDEFGKNCYQNLARYYIEQKFDVETSQKYQAVGILDFGTEALSQGAFDEALGFAKTAVRIGPDSAEAHYMLGQSLVALGRLDGAVKAYKKCVELDPTHGRGLMELKSLNIK